MSVTNVYHKSRYASFTLNFSATENNLSWSFTAENDGEIYDVVLNNVASYTVAGAAITLPYSLTGADSYAVSIVKEANGLPASITIKTRRALSKSSVLSVPDFGEYDGRYLYLLDSPNNIVIKVDTDLLSVSNYEGAGVWTTSPIISTINLPVLPDSAIWRSITFVKSGGIGRMFIQGSTVSGNLKVYASYILDDDSVVDMDYLTATPYTIIRSGNLKISSGCCVYDFVKEKVYIALASIGNGTTTLTYDLQNKISYESGLSSNSTRVVVNSGIRSTQFIPVRSRFSWISDIDLDTQRYFNYKPAQNSGNRSSYALSLDATDRNDGSLKVRAYFDQFGVMQARFVAPDSPMGGAPTNPYSITEVITLDALKSTFVINGKSYAIQNYAGGNSSASDVTPLEVGATALKSVMGSNRNNQFYALSSGTSSKRLFVFEPSVDPMHFAYLEFDNNIEQMHSNQLII